MTNSTLADVGRLIVVELNVRRPFFRSVAVDEQARWATVAP